MKTSAFLLMMACALAVLPAAAQNCNNANFYGTHFYLLEGYQQTPSGGFVPDKQLGVLVADANGFVTGSATESSNGIILHSTVAGTYTINADCSGAEVINSTQSDGTIVTETLTFQEINGARQQLVAITSPGYFLTGEQYSAASNCGPGSILGPYAYDGVGAPTVATTPSTTVGMTTFDGKGGFSAYSFLVNSGGTASNLSGIGSYTIKSDCTGTASFHGGTSPNLQIAVTASGTIIGIQTDSGNVASARMEPVNTPSVLAQIAFGGGWYTALYLTNDSGIGRSATVNFYADDGTPLNFGTQGSSLPLNIQAQSTIILEAPNTGGLSQGYAVATLPPGVTGYGVVRQSIAGIADQEAVVPLASASSTRVTLTWDDTSYVTAVAIANPSAVNTTVSVNVLNTSGRSLGTASIPLNAGTKTEATLRSLLPDPTVTAGQRGYATFTVTTGKVAVLGLRFNGSAFTSIPTTGN